MAFIVSYEGQLCECIKYYTMCTVYSCTIYNYSDLYIVAISIVSDHANSYIQYWNTRNSHMLYVLYIYNF